MHAHNARMVRQASGSCTAVERQQARCKQIPTSPSKDRQRGAAIELQLLQLCHTEPEVTKPP